MDIKQIMTIIANLPIEQRAEIASKILQELNAHDTAMKLIWIDEVERRAEEVDSGEVEMIPGDQVMQRLRSITRK